MCKVHKKGKISFEILSWQRQNKGGIYASNMDYRFCSLHLQSASEILEILRRAANTLHIQVERWDHRAERKVERQIKVLIEHLAIFFLHPSKKFLPISFKIQLLETSPQKQKGKRQKQLVVSFFWCLFPSCILSVLCSLLLLFTFCKVCTKETPEIETGMAEKSSWDQHTEKLGLVWRNRKKINPIIKDNFYLPFLIILPTLLPPPVTWLLTAPFW